MSTNTSCEEIQRIVWTEGPDGVPADVAGHVDGCADCSLEARRAGDVQAALAGLRAHQAPVPLELEAAIVAAVNRTRLDRARDVVTHPRFWKSAAVGAAAATAAVAGLLVARRIAARPGEASEEQPEPELVA